MRQCRSNGGHLERSTWFVYTTGGDDDLDATLRVSVISFLETLKVSVHLRSTWKKVTMLRKVSMGVNVTGYSGR